MSKLSWWKTWCVVLLVCTATGNSRAQAFRSLADFNGTDGAVPYYMALVQGLDGNLYGTTFAGGANNGGTVFRLGRTGALDSIYIFCSQAACEQAGASGAGLALATDGNFYGTASQGGANGYGGTVFRIAPNGALTTLYSFCSQPSCADGSYPFDSLVQSTDGSFYGVTGGGGTNGGGTVFKITAGGVLTTLYSFCSQPDCSDGSEPIGGLVQGTDGNFYGTTETGGLDVCPIGCGTVFRITPAGVLTTLHTFDSTDGQAPVASLVQGAGGDFYGTTESGGTFDAGTVFKISIKGTLTTIHSFCTETNCADGFYPSGALVQATDGNFYGTAREGGSGNPGLGTVFSITPGGVLTTLHDFEAQDGNFPYGGLVQDTDGAFYGATSYGGFGGTCSQYGCGTLFSLSVGLAPFVKTQPAFGKPGAAVKILGTNLTAASSVTFNGAPATFTVEAGSVIKATVPAGATTGTVQVVTPSGTLSSNVPFRVAP